MNRPRLRQVIDALFEEPDASALVLAERLRCSPQTVRRYRRLIDGHGHTCEKLAGLGSCELDTLFNRRSRDPTTRQPDFAALFAEPRVTVRRAWLDYRRKGPASAMAWSYFEKRHAAARKRHRLQRHEEEGAGGAPAETVANGQNPNMLEG